MARAEPTRVLVHADESCLGNGMEPPNPGGNAALIEAPAGDSVARWDFYECSPDTTNNKMALAGAIAALEWIRRQWRRARVLYVSAAMAPASAILLLVGRGEQAWEHHRATLTADGEPVAGRDCRGRPRNKTNDTAA